MGAAVDLDKLGNLIVTHLADCIRTVLQKFTEFERDLGVDLNGESKRFLGHLIAEVLKRRAGLEQRVGADFFFEGVPLEIKHTIHDNWMIAQENIGRGAILIKTDTLARLFSVGYLELIEENLNKGRNRDTKVSVSADGKTRIRWWLIDEPF